MPPILPGLLASDVAHSAGPERASAERRIAAPVIAPCRYCGSIAAHDRRQCRMRRLNADPAFKAANAERMRRLHADPAFKAANAERSAERMRRLHADPEFKAAHAERMRRLHAERRNGAPRLADLSREQRALYVKLRPVVGRAAALTEVQRTPAP